MCPNLVPEFSTALPSTVAHAPPARPELLRHAHPPRLVVCLRQLPGTVLRPDHRLTGADARSADPALLVRRRMAAVRRAHPPRRAPAARTPRGLRRARPGRHALGRPAVRGSALVRWRRGRTRLRAARFVALEDRPPFAVEYLGGPLAADGPVGGDDGLEVRYRVRCRGPGLARFEGVRVRVADFQGFFVHTAFVRGAAVYRVLPVLVEGGDPRPALKRDNQLAAARRAPPAPRRLRQRAARSARLHAWRSAQDHRLEGVRSAATGPFVTKVFESEAPVPLHPVRRCVQSRCACRRSTARSPGKPARRDRRRRPPGQRRDVREPDRAVSFRRIRFQNDPSRPQPRPRHAAVADPGRRRRPSPRPPACVDPDRLLPVAFAFAQGGLPAADAAGRQRHAAFWQEWFDSSPRYTHTAGSFAHPLPLPAET